MNRRKKKVGLPFRTLIALMAVTLLMGGAIGGTMAWLTTKSSPVTNTFTVGDINITLDEAKVNEAGKPVDGEGKEVSDPKDAERVAENTYKIVPGNTYTKDPTVTVKANSEDCYLFVKLIETNNPSNYFEYEPVWVDDNTTWTKVDDQNVWYCTVSSSTEDQVIELLEDNKISVKTTVVKRGSALENGQVEMPEDTETAKPKIVFKACAVQTANLTPENAWTEAAKLLAE